MSVLNELDWRGVRQQYEVREAVYADLLRLFGARETAEFFALALGISNAAGNYSASEHKLGPMVRAANPDAERRVYEIARQFRALESAREVPELIRRAGLKYFAISVGSELSCLVNPSVCWVANTRTIWTHLVIKHADNFARANEELTLYREADVNSEMTYQAWSAIHAELDVTMTRISENGSALASLSGVSPGNIKYLWADAIANAVYEARTPTARSWRSYR